MFHFIFSEKSILALMFIFIRIKIIICSHYSLAILPSSPIEANISNSSGIYMEKFDTIRDFFELVQIYENDLNIELSNDFIVNETIFIYVNCSLEAETPKKMIFSNLGQFVIGSEIQFNLINLNITENTNNSNVLSFFKLSEAIAVNFINCWFFTSFYTNNTGFTIFIGKNVATIVFESCSFTLDFQGYNQAISLNNISNYTFINSVIKNSLFTDSTFLSSQNTYIYIRNINISYNIIQQLTTSDSIFLKISNNIEIINMTFLQNKFNMPLLGNELAVNFLKVSLLNFNENIYLNNSNEISLIVLKDSDTILFESIRFFRNTVNGNLIKVIFTSFFQALNLHFIENNSKLVVLLELCSKIIINIFNCLQNNFDLTQKINFGSCLKITNSPLIDINSSKIANSYGTSNIPGIIIANNLISSVISLSFSVFLNNTYNSDTIVDSYGCALYIVSYPIISLANNHFKLNYAFINDQNFGGPMLFFISPKASSLIIENCVIENNFSYKKSLAIEFQGYDIMLNNCQFLTNLQYIYGFNDYYTETLLNGIAKNVRFYNCNILNNTSSDGLYFLYEQNYLIIHFEFCNILYNIGSMSAGFNIETETKNREIILLNSSFSNNSMAGGATFIYAYVYSTIVKLNFSCINSSINSNFVDSSSYGLIVFWTYSNNVTFNLINTDIFDNDFACKIKQRAFISFFGIRELIYVNMANVSMVNNIGGNIFIYYFQSYGILINVVFKGNNHVGTEPFVIARQSNFQVIRNLFLNNIISDSFFYFFGVCDINMESAVFQDNQINNYFIMSLDNLALKLYNLNVSRNTFKENYDFFLKLQNIANSLVENCLFFNNKGNFRVIFLEINSLIRISTLTFEINSTQNFILFDLYSSSLQIDDFEMGSGNMLCDNSQILVENVSFIQTSGNLKIYHIIDLFKSILNITQSKAFNLSMASSQYFINSFQSDTYINNLYIKNCQNIFLFIYSSLSLINSSFDNINNGYQYDELLYFQKSYQLSFYSCNFNSFSSNKASISIVDSLNNTYVSNCSFINHINSKAYGGVLYVKTSKIYIDSSRFYSNQALRGGAAYLECADEDAYLCYFSIKSSEFINNSALIDGGAYKFQFIKPININNTFIDNKAIYGLNYSSFLSRLGFRIIKNNITVFSSFESNNSDFFILQNIGSNKIVKYEIILYALDTFNQIILENMDMKISVDLLNTTSFPNNSKISSELINLTSTDPFYCSNTSTIHYIGKVSAVQESDYSFLFNDFSIITCPTSLLYMKFSTNSLTFQQNYISSKPNSLNEIISSYYSLIIPVKIDNCSIGEYYIPTIMSCQFCLEGYYSLENHTLNCKPCLKNTICEGGSEIYVDSHYWNDASFVENIYSCNIFLDNCLGGIMSDCLEGYEGVLCENCVKFKDNNIYYKDHLGECNQCPNVYLILFAYFILIVIFLIIMRLIIKIFDEDSNQNEDKKFALKILINFFHLLMYTKNQFEDLKYVSYEMQSILKNIKFFFKLEFIYISFDCLYFLSDHSNKENPYLDIILIIWLIYAIFICYIVILKIKNAKLNVIIRKFSLIFYVIFPILFNLLSTALCFRLINGNILFKKNTNFSFNDLKFLLSLFVFPNLILFSIILFVQNIILVKKHASHEITTLGLKTAVRYETLNFITMFFFNLLMAIEINNELKNEIIFFIYFYRLISELLLCHFEKSVYSKINFFYKLVFLFDYLILIFLSSGIYMELVFPLLIIEMILLVSFLFSLLLFFNNWTTKLNIVLFKRSKSSASNSAVCVKQKSVGYKNKIHPPPHSIPIFRLVNKSKKI